jgi:hypothetical protein
MPPENVDVVSVRGASQNGRGVMIARHEGKGEPGVSGEIHGGRESGPAEPHLVRQGSVAKGAVRGEVADT